jgi:hypothetical protein
MSHCQQPAALVSRALMIRRATASLCTLAVVVLSACSDDATSPAAETRKDGELGLGVDGQIGTVATALPQQLSLTVRDTTGQLLPNVAIRWEAGTGNGSISPATSRTGADGVSTAVWTLGEKAGPQEARAIVDGRDTVRIRALAQASTVVAKLDVTAPAEDVPLGVGRTVVLGVDLRDRFDNLLTSRAPVWRSLDPTLATVSELGVVVAQASGTARIVGTLDAVADTIAITINATQPRRWNQFAVGVSHTCAISAANETWCWGFNRSGQLGDGTIIHRTRPVRVTTPAGVRFTRLRAAGSTTCALDDVGRVWCWGLVPDQSLVLTPTLQPSSLVFTDVAVAAGLGTGAGRGPNVCALTAEGSAFCWGGGGAGQLGTGSTTSSLTPVQVTVPSGVRFAELAMGAASACARSTDGEAWCWGSLAASPSATNGRLLPAKVALPAGAVINRLTAGDTHVCATTALGESWCWGRTTRGQLGATAPATTYTPVALTAPAGKGLRSVHAQGLLTCALLVSGEVSCMGAGTAGEQGNGVFLDRNSQGLVSTAAGVRFTDLAGGAHACGLTEGGDLFCWGAGTWGGLGGGDFVSYAVPRKVRNP